jgi:hypothetical protein
MSSETKMTARRPRESESAPSSGERMVWDIHMLDWRTPKAERE